MRVEPCPHVIAFLGRRAQPFLDVNIVEGCFEFESLFCASGIVVIGRLVHNPGLSAEFLSLQKVEADMSLEEQINKDYVSAMKDRNTQKSAAINYLRAMIKQVKVDRRLEQVDDAEVIAVIKKQIKQRQDSIEQFERGGRTDLVAQEKFEIDMMKVYLPAELSAHEIKAVIADVIQGLGSVSIKDIGAVMKAVREKAGSRADGRLVSELVKESLAAQ